MTNSTEKKNSTIWLYIFGIILGIGACNACGGDYSSESRYQRDITANDAENKIPVLTEAQKDSIKEVSKKARYATHIKNLSEGIRKMETWNKSYTSIPQMGDVLAEFKKIADVATSAQIINRGYEKADSTNLAKLITQTRSKLQSLQAREFPKMRRRFAEVMDGQMWEHNIDVRTNRTKSRGLVFTGGIFFSNSNIKDSYISGIDGWEKMRFTRVDFKPYDGAREWTYYSIESKSDVDINW